MLAGSRLNQALNLNLSCRCWLISLLPCAKTSAMKAIRQLIQMALDQTYLQSALINQTFNKIHFVFVSCLILLTYCYNNYWSWKEIKLEIKNKNNHQSGFGGGIDDWFLIQFDSSFSFLPHSVILPSFWFKFISPCWCHSI